MVLARRRAEVGWQGTLEEGRGSFTVGSWMVGEVPVTWSSRTSPEEESTSPEELMAAAHASCYAMALSLVLGERGTPPESIDVQAACALDAVSEGFRITTMDLEVRGRVPNLDAEGFRRAADYAHQICPVSNALKDNVEVRVNTTLED
jgi:osmotically inducible protein OsmC